MGAANSAHPGALTFLLNQGMLTGIVPALAEGNQAVRLYITEKTNKQTNNPLTINKIKIQSLVLLKNSHLSPQIKKINAFDWKADGGREFCPRMLPADFWVSGSDKERCSQGFLGEEAGLQTAGSNSKGDMSETGAGRALAG